VVVAKSAAQSLPALSQFARQGAGTVAQSRHVEYTKHVLRVKLENGNPRTGERPS
jgi:hypothetical protein